MIVNTYAYHDECLAYNGRVYEDVEKQKMYFDWTCSGFEFLTDGNKVQVLLDTNKVEENERLFEVWVAVFVDQESIPYKIFPITQNGEYTIFESSDGQYHHIKVVKRTEAQHAQIALKQVSIYNGQLKSYQDDKVRKIEFIGDSITCGYGNETNRPEDGFWPQQENGLKAYAALTAQNVNAKFQCVSVSGIGVYSSYTGENKINDTMLMKDVYEQTNYFLNKGKSDEQKLMWDFKRFEPNLIVINLGSNDHSYLTYDYETRMPAFVQSYVQLLTQVRRCNGVIPFIVCCIGWGKEEMYEAIQAAIVIHKANTGDESINSVLLSPPQEGDGMGGSFHPTVKTHERMAQELTDKIKEWMAW